MKLSVSPHTITLFSFHTRLHRQIRYYLLLCIYALISTGECRSRAGNQVDTVAVAAVTVILWVSSSLTLIVIPCLCLSSARVLGEAHPLIPEMEVFISRVSLSIVRQIALFHIWKVVVSQILGVLFIYQRSAYDYASNWMIEISRYLFVFKDPGGQKSNLWWHSI